MRVAPLVYRESGVMVVIQRFDVFTTEIWSIKVSHYRYNKIMLGKQYSTLVATDTTCNHKPVTQFYAPHTHSHRHTHTHTHTH